MSEGVSLPIGRGRGAHEYLQSQGLEAIKPCIRSSDYELGRSCEFAYYLRRRLGLCPALQYGKALARGSWFHKRLELFQSTEEEARAGMEAALAARQQELREIAGAQGISPDKTLTILSREEQDCWSACGWYEAMWSYRAEGLGEIGAYLTKPYWRPLGCEVILVHQDLEFPDTPSVAAIDLLLYHHQHNTLWIVDFKTCSESTDVRLATCPIEFQTQHYLHVTKSLLDKEILQPAWGLPGDCKLGGMLHIAIQKPTISFNQMDRDFEEYEHTFSRGSRKGEVEIRRKYSGEPLFSNFLSRCQRWYHARGEYENKRQERIDCPPVNISRTPANLCLNGAIAEEYTARLSYVRKLANLDPEPANFLMSASYLRSFGRLNPLSPFYLCPVHQWPDIMAQEGLVVQHRDEGIDRETPVGAL